jgi:hypothetical protein
LIAGRSEVITTFQPRDHQLRGLAALASPQRPLLAVFTLLVWASIDADAWATRLVPPGDAEEERLKQLRTPRSTPALRLSRYFKPLRAATS